MATPFHILVENNAAIIYASRRGEPTWVLSILNPFLEKFWQERETAGEHEDTPECLLAQILVRFGFELCEDDYSNLRVGTHFKADAAYLYTIGLDLVVTVWVPDPAYRNNPNVGLTGCVQSQQFCIIIP